MKKKTIAIALTAAGLLATSASSYAQNVFEQVTGILNRDVTVIVNGEKTELVPVYIDGKAYLPVREAAAGLGYEASYDAAKNEISLQDIETVAEEEEAEMMRGTGVIADVAKTEDGLYRVEFLGLGSNAWVILTVDHETIVEDQEGNGLSAADLKEGTQIVVEYGPVMAMSFPGQSHAAKITVVAERLVKEDAIQSVERTDDGWQVRFGEAQDDALILNAGKETVVLTDQGEPVKWEVVKAGMNVQAYYGPVMTKSLPPQSPLYVLVVPSADPGLPAEAVPEDLAEEYRELAWSVVGDQDDRILTDPDEAAVAIVPAVDSPVIAATEAQQRLLADIREADGRLATVTYETEQGDILGPLTVAFDVETKAFVGYYPRR